MLFNSYEFIFLFLPITLVVYLYLVHGFDRRLSISWLIFASLFFYGWWNPAYLGLILGSMLFNFSVGILLTRKKSLIRRKVVLVAGIAVNLAALAYFKYAGFFFENLSLVFDLGWNVENIILPLAISFFTFQQITYLVDAYRHETKEYDFTQYALFVTFFPQLIAGPIVHHKEMMPQFFKGKKFRMRYEYIAIGASIFFLGLFKKVVIADSLSPYVSESFAVVSSGVLLTFFEAWLGVLAYTFQLYFDFSGYSDMAVGLAFLFGIRLPLNFNSPYKSTSIIEFWRRWHITLSRFLKEYLYIPLGGNRRGEVRRNVNIMITMLLGGLWHGAGWTFIIWGGLHGLYLVLNHGWRNIKSYLGIPVHGGKVAFFLSRLFTFLAVVIAWAYFRADSLESANLMVKSLFAYGGVYWPEEARSQLGIFADMFSRLGLQYGYLSHFNGRDHLIYMLVLLIIVWKTPNIHQLFYANSAVLDPPQASSTQWKPTTAWLLMVILVAMISILKLGQVSEFLYFQF